jgi:hypothetical protein
LIIVNSTNMDTKEYMALSKDPNERGRLWKAKKEKRLFEKIPKGIEKLSPIEIIDLYRYMTISICSVFAPRSKVAEVFDKNLVEEIKNTRLGIENSSN